MDAELSRRIDKARSRRIRWTWVAVAACMSAGVVAVTMLVDYDDVYVRGDTTRQVGRVALTLIAIGFMVAYFVLAARRGDFRSRRQSLLWILPRAEVRRLRKAVRRNVVPPGVPWHSLRAAAEAMQRGRLQILLNAGIGLNGLAQVSSLRGPLGWYFAALVGLVATAGVRMIWDGRAADWFLTTHEGAGAFED